MLTELNLLPSPQISGQMTSSGTLLTSPGIPIGPPGNPFTVFQVGYWKFQRVSRENHSFVVKTGFKWEGGSPTKRDTWTEIWGDGIDAAVKDGAAIVIRKKKTKHSSILILYKLHNN